MSRTSRDRTPKLEKSCPLQQTHTRLHHVHDLWHRVAADYCDPDAFVVSFNASLQALRSVSFMLQKESARIPDFKKWYASHEAQYQSDPLMRWLKNARNYVEKEGDLDLHSRVRVNLLGVGAKLPELDFELHPLLTQEEIASLMGPRLPERVRSVAVLEVERRWVSADLPEHELLDLLAYGYGVVAEVVADAHRQCGALMQTFGDEAHGRRPSRERYLGGRLPCMVAHRELRTAHMHLGRNVLMSVTSHERQMTHDDIEEPPFELPESFLNRDEGEDLLTQAGRWVQFAQLVTKAQGYHLPMATVYPGGDEAAIIHQLHAEDWQEQLMMMEAVAREVERRGAEGVMFIGELSREGPDGTTLCVAAASDDGSRRQWLTPMSYDGNDHVQFGETRVEDGIVPDFFSPVLRAWTRIGRGASTVTSKNS